MEREYPHQNHSDFHFPTEVHTGEPVFPIDKEAEKDNWRTLQQKRYVDETTHIGGVVFPTSKDVLSGGPNFPQEGTRDEKPVEFVDISKMLVEPIPQNDPKTIQRLMKKIELLQDTGFTLDDILEDDLDLFSKEEQALLRTNYPEEIEAYREAQYQKKQTREAETKAKNELREKKRAAARDLLSKMMEEELDDSPDDYPTEFQNEKDVPYQPSA